MGIVAYLDANSGNMLIGAVAAAGAGVAVAAKVGWGRVAGRFSKKSTAESATDGTEDTGEAVPNEAPATVSDDS